MAFFSNIIIQPSDITTQTYTMQGTRSTRHEKTISECISLLHTKMANANIMILYRNSSATAYYILGINYITSDLYAGDTHVYPPIAGQWMYFGSGSDNSNVNITEYVLNQSGTGLENNGWVTYQSIEIGEIGNVLANYTDACVFYAISGYNRLIINSGPIPLHTWSSVPAISGKNGTLSLSTIKSAYINDGEPVTGATASNFDALTEETNVGTLVNDTSVDESKVVVRYNIPDGTYQYIKLVYKPNSEPETVSDGVVINIPQVDSQVVIDDIITTGTYYFKIFTNAGNSNTVVLNYVGIVPIIINIERVW